MRARTWGLIGLTIAVSSAAGAYAWWAKGAVEREVREIFDQVLLDPESAKLRMAFRSPIDAETYCGEVNARNRMGGMVGYRRFIAWGGVDVRAMYDNDADSEITEKRIEELKKRLKFAESWGHWCEPSEKAARP